MSILLADNQKARYAIVLPPDAPAQTSYAATELRYYLGLITAADFEIMTVPFQGPQILLQQEENDLGEDGFAINAEENHILILGGKRGVIYGVYAFLEYLGCRFFTSACEQVPSLPHLELTPFCTRQTPAFEYRDHNYADLVQNPRFAVKCRLNGSTVPIPEKFGGHMMYVWFVHTFNQMVPVETYGKSHPEYFALYNGKRHTHNIHTQLCLTNPAVYDIALQSVRNALRANPGKRIISISQNDSALGCECENCRRADQEEGSPSGTLLRFVNRIAEALEPEFPDVIFDTLAYTYTRPVPHVTRPRHNVCIRLCSIECCFAHPIESCSEDRSVVLPNGSRTTFPQDLKNWGEYHNRLYVWDYTANFSHYPMPYPNWHVLQPNMRLFCRHHVKGVFEQANGAAKGGVDLNELRAYVLCKLMWDPDTDVETHIQEFTDSYYGPAAPHVRTYIETLCQKAAQDNIHIDYLSHPELPLYDESMLDTLDALLSQAEKAVQDDALRLWRIGKLRLSIRYVRIKRRSMLQNQLDPAEVNAFFTDWKAYGMSRMEEWVSAETSHLALLKHMWKGRNFYIVCHEEGPEQF